MDEKKKNKGATLDILGYWSPKNKEVNIDKDKLKLWIDKGAKKTAAVEKLL